MSTRKPVLVRDIEIEKIYACPKTKQTIGRLKEKVIYSTYGMHNEPIFRLLFRIDEFSEPIFMYNDWLDQLCEIDEPKKPTLLQLTTNMIQKNPENFELNDTIKEIMSMESNK
jgi:transcription elongation factor Elf1